MAERHGAERGCWANTEVSFYCEKMLFWVRAQEEKQMCLETPEKKVDSLRPPSPDGRQRAELPLSFESGCDSHLFKHQ